MTEEQKPEKTEEQLKSERLERYKAKPDDFFELSDIVVACLRIDKCLGVLIGNSSRTELEIAKTKVDHVIDKTFLRMDMDAAMQQQSKLVKPGDNGKHRIMDFLRNKK